MALLFESDDVIREEVEHSVFTGSTNEGLAGDLACFFVQDVQVINVCAEVRLACWARCRSTVYFTSLYRMHAQTVKLLR